MVGRGHVGFNDAGCAARVFAFLPNYRFCFWSFRQESVSKILLGVAEVQLAIEITSHAYLAPGHLRFACGLQLIELICEPHDPISAQGSFFLDTEDAGQVIPFG